MRNIFLFIRRFMIFFVFMILQGIALWMLFKYNRFHRAVGLGVSSEFTGKVNQQVDKLDDYFNQGEENKRVHRMNDSLMNLLRTNFYVPDTGGRLVIDSVMVTDSTKGVRRWFYRDAKVVYNTVNFEKNYLQLDRGSKHGVADEMAVLSSDGSVVGVVVNVSANFSHVMSLLHIQSSVSASLKKGGESGRIEWDGRHPQVLYLRGISKSVKLAVGDSVLTSKYSYNFPPGKLIGTIAQVSSDPATGFYILRIRPAVNFANVQQVFVVENLLRGEQVLLEKETEKKIEQQRNNRP
jgi:rod shape-determining protein MreC